MVDETNYGNPLKDIEDAERASMDMSDQSDALASKAEVEETFGPDYEVALQEELKLRDEYGDNTAALRNFAERTASSASLGLSDYALVKAFGPKMAEALKQRKRLNKKTTIAKIEAVVSIARIENFPISSFSDSAAVLAENISERIPK